MRPDRAWFIQARSDLTAAVALERAGDACQCIMHLQMCGEKLIKGYLRRVAPPPRVHNVVRSSFRYLETIILGTPKLRDRLMGYKGARISQVKPRLISLERTMLRIELLNPSVAGYRSPNCEYPWEPVSSVGYAPSRHRFGRAVGKAARAKVYRLLDRILVAEGV